MAREITEVIDAMRVALMEDALRFGSTDRARTAIARLDKVRESVMFTPPESMAIRWRELVIAFNASIFETLEEQYWSRSATPRWAVRTGRILAGELEC